jgi:glucokinase
MRAGDEAAKEVVDTYLHYLACGIANLLNIFQPEILSIGGGVSGEGQALLDALLPLIRKECYGGSTVKQTEIRIATLGNDAGIVGAAVLGL